MTAYKQNLERWFGSFLLALALIVVIPASSWAQRDVHWQIEPAGFPEKVSVFVDVEESYSFRRDLTAEDFSISIDEHVGEQGGHLRNADKVAAGIVGAQILLLVDRSKTYSGEFAEAKKAMGDIISRLDPGRDQVAIISAPSGSGYSDTVLEHPFTNDRIVLQETIDRLSPLGGDITPVRICHALTEAVRAFPEERTERFRAVVFFSAGVDRGEGRGDCVQRSFQAGKVPFFMITFEPDRRYRDQANEHRVENALDALAKQTGGRSIFRRDTSQVLGFVNKLVYRIRNQYRLEVEFPCYRPAPTTEHLAVLKVEGRDAEGLRFQAPSTLAPVPQILSLRPAAASRHDVDEGEVELTIGGRGFCGPHSGVKAFIGESPLVVSEADPYRVVGKLRSNVETGDVKVINRFGEVSEGDLQFKVLSPEAGEDASTALTILILAIVSMALVGVLLFAFRSRRAKVDPSQKRSQQAPKRQPPRNLDHLVGIDAAKTVPMQPIGRAWVELDDGGKTIMLEDGENIIGRDPSCRIRIDIRGVSREHAKIELNAFQGALWLEDLGSMNGTFWGSKGRRSSDATPLAERRLLEPGDVIIIGGKRMILHVER